MKKQLFTLLMLLSATFAMAQYRISTDNGTFSIQDLGNANDYGTPYPKEKIFGHQISSTRVLVKIEGVTYNPKVLVKNQGIEYTEFRDGNNSDATFASAAAVDTWFKENTGFKTASGGSEATTDASDLTTGTLDDARLSAATQASLAKAETALQSVTEPDVTQHEDALSIDASQVSNLPFIPTADQTLDMADNDITNAGSISVGGASDLRILNVKGEGLDGRLSIQGSSDSDNPGIEFTVDNNASRTLIRGARFGTSGMNLEFYTQVDGANLTHYWTILSTGELHSESGRRITGISNPISSNDAVNLQYANANYGRPSIITLSSNRDLDGTDSFNTISCTTSSTLTIPLNLADIVSGTVINLEVLGTTLTVTGVSGVIVNGVDGGSVVVGNNSAYLSGFIRKVSPNVFIVM